MNGAHTEGSASLRRALIVLEAVSKADDRGLSLAECASLLQLSKATTFRILHTLAELEFLHWDQEAGLYSLGVQNLRLGMRYLDRLDLRREALPTLRALRDTTGETIHLGIMQGPSIVYIDKVETTAAVRMASRLGDSAPIYCTSIGKAILAHLPPSLIEERLRGVNFEARTVNTITDLGKLRQEIERTRERGFAIDDVEHEEGIRCLGAAILDASGWAIGGISISGPTSRIIPERYEDLTRNLLSASESISKKFGFDSTSGPLPVETAL